MVLNLQGYPIELPDPPKDVKEIFGYEKPKSEQYWVRPYTLSDEQYDQLTPAQQREVRETETARRVNGFWFYNNGRPIWLTGDAYFYFTHWVFDGERPWFLMNQLEDFYFDYFCENDPYCFGSVRMKPRREGCTARRLSCFVNQGTLEFDCHYGIQSKNAEDAETVNFDNLIKSFFKIPKFMQPMLQNTSLPPHKEIIFGKRRSVNKKEEGLALNTKIDWRASVENAYDGSKLKKILGDECFKMESMDLDKWWDIVKYCLQNRGVIYGKAYLLSTVGEISTKTIESTRNFWRGSNYGKRDNGQTATGVYRWFIPDWCAYFGLKLNANGDEDKINGKPVLDKYGYVNIPLVKKYLKKKFDAIQDSTEKVNFIRKNPPTAEDALNYGSTSNVFDTIRIADRLTELDNFVSTEEKPVKYLVGTLFWVNNERFGQVSFRPDEKGKWKIAYLPNIAGDERMNRIYRENNVIRPFSDTPFRMGVDPYQMDNKTGKGYSKGAFHVKLMDNMLFPHLSNIYCCEYIYREKLAEMFYEDIALTMFFYGAKVNIERSAYSDGVEKFMQRNRVYSFLMRRPDITKNSAFTKRDNEKGTPASEQNIAMGIRYIENYIAEPNPLINENTFDNLQNFWFETTLKQLMDYTMENKTEFDLVASMQQTEIACQPDKKVKAAAKDQVDVRRKIFNHIYNLKEKPKQFRELV